MWFRVAWVQGFGAKAKAVRKVLSVSCAFSARHTQGGGRCCQLLLVTAHRVCQLGLSGALCAYRACQRLKPFEP